MILSSLSGNLCVISSPVTIVRSLSLVGGGLKRLS